jgi:putative iron-dependent peroxidase
VTAQPGIFALGTSEHLYIQADLVDGASPADVVAAVVDVGEELTTTSGANLVVGFRPTLWPGFAHARPADALGFDADVVGLDGYRMPAAQHDVWLWTSAGSRSAAFDTVLALLRYLGKRIVVRSETDGWSYQTDRDLTGFIDGTENPAALEAPEVVAPGGSGSIVLVQTWLHDADALARMSVREQELMMGRTKADSTELDDATQPPTSHVSRTTLTEPDGEELHIWRRNTATGTPARHGTQFVGFSRDRARLHRMLERMAGVGDGVRDTLTTIARPLDGAYYYVPSVEELAELGGPPSS